MLIALNSRITTGLTAKNVFFRKSYSLLTYPISLIPIPNIINTSILVCGGEGKGGALSHLRSPIVPRGTHSKVLATSQLGPC